MAIPLRPNDVPKELICSICLLIPLDIRLLKPCKHVFCKDCIDESLFLQKSCPRCRCACKEEDVLVLNDKNSGFYRIWASLAVKCKHHAEGCCWTGSLSEYQSHKHSCPRKENIQQICSLKEENESLKKKNMRLKNENVYLKRQCLEQLGKRRRLKREYQNLKKAQDDSNKRIKCIKKLINEIGKISSYSGNG
jgi:hypothetical protein